MTGYCGLTIVLLCASLGICACTKQLVPMPGGPNQGPVPPGSGGSPNLATVKTLDFLAGIYIDPFSTAIRDNYLNDTAQPLGTKNDEFGGLTTLSNPTLSLTPPGLETLLSPPLGPRDQHTGRVNRDTRIADFENTGFPGIISNTYDCVDPLNPDDIARLYKNNGDGTFTEVLNPFRDHNGQPITIQGRGETIVVADFNNDGFLDIFIPYYTYKSADPDPEGPPGAICQNSIQSYLLLNDGTGHFTDVADAAGVSLRNLEITVEGAQAVDLNNDGLIDLCAGSHLFINTGITNGIPHFIDMGPTLGLPLVFEEGVKFVDAYNDGFLDLVLLDPNKGPALFRLEGSATLSKPGALIQLAGPRFVQQPTAFPGDIYRNTFGVNAYDINGDGLEDVITTGGDTCDPKIFLNTGNGFERVPPQSRPFTLDAANDPQKAFCLANGAVAFADLNNDGQIDVLSSTFTTVLAFVNNSKPRNPFFVVEVLGPNGEHNQQGRVVRVSPRSRPDVIFTRVVDSGSGYLSQSQYPLLISSPYSEQHIVTLSLPQIFNHNKLVNITFTILPGQKARVFAPSSSNPKGRVEIVPVRPFTFDPALYPAAQGILE